MADLTLTLRLDGSLPALRVLDRFVELAKIIQVPITRWHAYASGDDDRPGGVEALRHYISEQPQDIDSFHVREDAPHPMAAHRRDGAWTLRASERGKTDAAWVQTCIGALRALDHMPDLIDGSVDRGSYDFPLRPPIAANAYAVLVTPAAVADAYDESEVFWRAWDQVEDRGAFKLCLRALTCLDEERWLGSTFERTMMLARAAKPGLTKYPGTWQIEDLGPWWEFGDVQDEKAGYPLLDLVGYDASTRTLEYAAKPGHRGHVLIQEIVLLRGQMRKKKTRAGEPLDAIRIVFLDEATARAEKRPLLDAGAHVYFTGGDDQLVEVH